MMEFKRIALQNSLSYAYLKALIRRLLWNSSEMGRGTFLHNLTSFPHLSHTLFNIISPSDQKFRANRLEALSHVICPTPTKNHTNFIQTILLTNLKFQVNMNKNLLRTLFLTAIFAMGASSLWADDDAVEYQLLKTVDFEDGTYSEDDWSSSNADISIIEDDDNNYFYATVTYGYTGSVVYTISSTSFLAADQWKLEFDYAGSASNSGTSYHYFYDESGNILYYITIAGWASTAYVYNSSDEELVTLTVDNGNVTTTSNWYTMTLIGDEDGVSLSIVDEDGAETLATTSLTTTSSHIKTLSFGLGKSLRSAIGVDNIKLYIVSDAEVVNTPTATLTGVNGTSRTITMSCDTDGATIYYSESEDLSDPTEYSEPISISETKTLYVYATTSTGGQSETATYTFEAGTEVSLADIEYSITSLDKSGSSYYPSYSFSIDNSDVLLTPEATLSATYDGEEISDFDGTFEAYGTGTLVVTATADGYADATLTIEITTYSLTTTSTDYSNVSGDDIELGLLGEGWTVSTSATRWSSWSKTAGVDTDLEANGGSSYYEATNDSTSVTLDDFVTFENSGGVVLLIGYGIGSNARANYARISDAEEGSVASYSYWSYGSSTGIDYVAYTEDNTDLEYTISRYSQAVYKVQYYTANASTSTAIQNVAVESAGSADAYYTLQGIKVQNPSKGLYIQNGKKVIIK